MLEKELERYIELKAQIKKLESECKKIQQRFDDYFKTHNLKEFTHQNYRLIKQERRTVSYKDEIKEFLKSKGFWEAVAIVDKTKVDKLIKAKLLSPEEISPYQDVKISHAWIVETVKKETEESAS